MLSHDQTVDMTFTVQELRLLRKAVDFANYASFNFALEADEARIMGTTADRIAEAAGMIIPKLSLPMGQSWADFKEREARAKEAQLAA